MVFKSQKAIFCISHKAHNRHMHLRLGRSRVSKMRIVSQFSTHSNKAPISRPLDPINEHTLLDADSKTITGSEAFLSMGDFPNFARQTNTLTTMQ